MIDRLSRGDKMNALQQAKYDLVLTEIKKIMLDQGINSLTIADIAKQVKVGEATIYRYFGTKTNLVIEVGISLWNDVYKEMLKLPKQNSGYEAVSSFFRFFLEGYIQFKEVFRFLDEFDSLMVKEGISKESLEVYDNTLLKTKQLYDIAFYAGLNDHSINKEVNQDEFYYTTTHMILGICEKLAANKDILSSDDIVKDIRQIELALDICLTYIKKEEKN